MSYIQMDSAPVRDVSKAIISFWFRDPTKNNTLPPAEEWPDGFWTPESADTVMIPPNTQFLTGQVADGITPTPTDFKNCVFFFNSFGVPFGGIGGQIFGSLFLQPNSVWIPTPPPLAIKNMHLLMAFGDPNQAYNYYEWHTDYPGVIDAVDYIGSIVPGIGFEPDSDPPPYAPYNTSIGDGGLFHVRNVKISGSPTNKTGMVPQSFIGVDQDGFLTVNLQTSTRGNYTGCSYMIDTVETLWATPTTLEELGPPRTYTQIGFPFPDMKFVFHPGYWNGYQFNWVDISNQIMAAAPESFVLGGPGSLFEGHGPQVDDGEWHHVLLSFDISGAVHCAQPADQSTLAPTCTTGCRAWLAVDGKNYTAGGLQHAPPIPNVFNPPPLNGVQSTDVFSAFGPMATYSRDQLGLGPNDIVPQNVFMRPNGGNPRDGLQRYAANSDILAASGSPALSYGAHPGDFNPLDWTASLWPLYVDKADNEGSSHGMGVLTPPAPSTPDPATFATPAMDYPDGFTIPLNGFPISFPAGARHLDHNTGCEMAEFQMWVGKTIDTGLVSNVRLFLDADGKPARPSVAQGVLGKPDILLHGTKNWQAGRNTGSATGNFTPVARIPRYKPDPQLGK